MTLYMKYVSMHLKGLMQYKLSFFLVAAGQFLTAFSTFLGVYFMFVRFNEVEGFFENFGAFANRRFPCRPGKLYEPVD